MSVSDGDHAPDVDVKLAQAEFFGLIRGAIASARAEIARAGDEDPFPLAFSKGLDKIEQTLATMQAA